MSDEKPIVMNLQTWRELTAVVGELADFQRALVSSGKTDESSKLAPILERLADVFRAVGAQVDPLEERLSKVFNKFSNQMLRALRARSPEQALTLLAELDRITAELNERIGESEKPQEPEGQKNLH
jgi:hypothetical protein